MSNAETITPRPGLPPSAKLVFQGVIFEVWQWEQEMFDGTKETFERIWRPPTVEVIATVGDRIILEEQDQPDRHGNLNFVSGRADKNGDVMAEAKRELLEETGYESDDWELFLKHGLEAKILHDCYYFIARGCRRVREPQLDAGERIETRLISFEELIRLSDEPRFWVAPQFVNFLLRLQADPQKREEFQKKLFP
ncbi:MAG: NUDIX hydrolase [Patescibacteria group bacterium]|nr:NUDIX hydrolase [Patescibacteria group bacterium]